jgi:hypothetical protein
MKYLNTIVTTSYNAAYKAHVEKTYSLIRPYCLTHKGAYRALKNEYPELHTASLVVCRVEHASIQSR